MQPFEWMDVRLQSLALELRRIEEGVGSDLAVAVVDSDIDATVAAIRYLSYRLGKQILVIRRYHDCL